MSKCIKKFFCCYFLILLAIAVLAIPHLVPDWINFELFSKVIAAIPDWLAKLAAAVTWPIATLTIFFVLFRNRRSVAELIKSIKWGKWEVIFRDNIDKLGELSNIVLSSHPKEFRIQYSKGAEATATSEFDDILGIAKFDPTRAMLECWKKLEAKLLELRQYHGLMSYISNARFVNLLEKNGRISAQEVELFNRLRQIRNSLVHIEAPYDKIDVDEVFEYFRAVKTLIARLAETKHEPLINSSS